MTALCRCAPMVVQFEPESVSNMCRHDSPDLPIYIKMCRGGVIVMLPSTMGAFL